ATEVVYFKPIFRHILLYDLPAIRKNHSAHHVVTFDGSVPGFIQAFEIDVDTIQLEVAMNTDATELKTGIAAHPVGLLNVGERKRLVAVLRIGNDLRQFGFA